MQPSTSTETESPSHCLDLTNVHSMVVDRAFSVLSLDIFDTVLWRRVPRPTDVFGMLARQLRRKEYCPSWVTDATFRRMRIAAEEHARASRGSASSEVSLGDIWRAMPLSIFKGALLEELVQTEVDTEKALTVADLDIAEIADLAGKHGIPIILVSDTYFNEDQLSWLLDRIELDALRGARIFPSHQYGASKDAGLWEIVLNDLGISPEQLVHIGDNETADHTVPARLGVRTVHYERLDEDFADILRREHEPQDSVWEFDARLDSEQGDFGLTGLRAKTLRPAASASVSPSVTAWRCGASVLGPVLTGFAEWVAQKAHDMGTPVVWCPMREGELLAELVNNAAEARSWQVRAKPLWLSRQVTSVAALDCFDQDSLREFIGRSYRLTVAQLLSTLNLRPGDVPCLVEHLGDVLDNHSIVDQVSMALTESPHLQNHLAVLVTGARERLLRAVSTSGALDNPDLTLVDLGWAGTIQLQLARVLDIAQIGITPAGLYLATDERATRVYRAGLRAEGYLGQAGHPRELVEAISRSPEVVEQCTSALCGSLVDFSDDGAPVLAPAPGNESQDIERRAVQAGISAFQQNWNRYVQNSDGGWPDLAGAGREPLATILTSFLRAPTAREASVFGNWHHDDNFGSSVVTRIVPEDLRAALPYLSPNDLDDLHMRDAFWPTLIAASDTHLSTAAWALSTGLIDSTMFEPSGQRFDTHVRFRTEDGQWHDGPRRRVRINHNGLSFARINLHTGNATDVSLAIPGRPAIVRVDWIEAKVVAEGRRQPEVLRWEKAEDFSGLTYAECTWLGGNMVEFHAPHAAMWLPLASRTGAPITSAQITVAFAMLPQSLSRCAYRMPPATAMARLTGRMREEYQARGPAGVASGAARIAVRYLGGER